MYRRGVRKPTRENIETNVRENDGDVEFGEFGVLWIFFFFLNVRWWW